MLTATIVIAAALVGIGALGRRLLEVDSEEDIAVPFYFLIFGWAACSLLAVACAITGARLSWPMTAAGSVGIIGLAASWRNWRAIAPLAVAWLLLLPLSVIASSIPPTMYDEFVQWLPNAHFLVDHDAFPDALHPNIWGEKAGYPPALPLIGYAVGRVIDHGYEVAPRIFNILLGGGFGLLLAGPLSRRLDRFIAVPMGVAAATVLDPFFDPRTALTSYSDTPTAFVLAACVSACWRSIGKANGSWEWRAAAAAVVLILLRETNVVLLAGVAFGLLLMGRPGYRMMAVLCAVTVVTFGLWRVFLELAAIPPAIVPRPLAEWDWYAPRTVLRVLFTERLANNPVLGATAALFAATTILSAGWVVSRASVEMRRLFLMIVAVSGLWLAFLAWSYIAVFSPAELAMAGSTWRYVSQLGPLLLYALAVAAAYGASAPARRIAIGIHTIGRQSLAALCCLVTPAVALAAWRHWRIDCQFPEVAVLQDVARRIGTATSEAHRIDIVHPTEAAWYGIIVDYTLHRPRWHSRFSTSAVPSGPDDYLLDLSEVSRNALLQTKVVPPTVLSTWNGSGWQPILRIEAARIAGCAVERK